MCHPKDWSCQDYLQISIHFLPLLNVHFTNTINRNHQKCCWMLMFADGLQGVYIRSSSHVHISFYILGFFYFPFTYWVLKASPCGYVSVGGLIGCSLSVGGCWLSAVGCWLLSVGYLLLVGGCWLLSVCCLLVVVGCVRVGGRLAKPNPMTSQFSINSIQQRLSTALQPTIMQH